MAASHFVADTNLANLCYKNLNLLQHTRFKLMASFARKFTHTNHFATARIIHTLARIAHILSLFAKDSSQKALFAAELLLTLWRNFTNQHIASFDFTTNLYNTVFVQVAQAVLVHIWNITRGLLVTKLGFAYFYQVILDINTGESIILYQAATNDDGVVHVVTTPRHKGNAQVAAKRNLAISNRGTFNQHIALLDLLAAGNASFLINRAVIVTLFKVDKLVALGAISVLHGDNITISTGDFTIGFSYNQLARITCHNIFDTGADRWRFWLHQWYCLTLHVGARQTAVNTVFLDKWHQARR